MRSEWATIADGRGYHPPTQPLVPVFSLHQRGALDRRTSLGIDWFYYTPDPSVSGRQVVAHVRRLRRAYPAGRVNTTGRSLEPPPCSSPLTYRGGSCASRFELELSAARAPDGMVWANVYPPPWETNRYDVTWWVRRARASISSTRRPRSQGKKSGIFGPQ